MIDVMIVEDEILIRTGMKTLINWNENGFNLAAEASNGEEALKILMSRPIDIVITDVRMPVMDGLQLLEKIRKKCIRCEVIILSSYDEFQYVKQAMVQGARDYIHKPTMMPEDIIKALKRVAAEIEKNRTVENYRRLIKDTYEETQDVILEKAIRQSISGEALPEEYLTVMENAGLSQKKFYILMMRVLNQTLKNFKMVMQVPVNTALREMFEEIANRDKSMVCYFQDGEYWTAVLDTAMPGEYLDKIHLELAEKYGMLCAITVSQSAFSYEELSKGYLSCKQEVEKNYGELDKNVLVNPAVKAALRYLHENYAKEIKLESAAKHAHVNASYLSRLFIKETGETFIDCLTRIRLEQAKVLLEKTDCNLNEISERIGYQNSKYLMKIFKKSCGMTPSEYREACKKNSIPER